MLFTLLMVLYVVLAIFMIGFILIQRGAGASAGSGFGAGASATVFGARGAASFLTKATKWLAISFFVLTLGMAMYVQRTGLVSTRAAAGDAGVMSGLEVPAAPAPQQAPAGDVPVVPVQAQPETAADPVPEPAQEDDGN
ncbi:MAG: preprotein translocase subunit SecG [Xanthomonadales bacterium]|nr:preprotein translocase subunit SecG [Xanthomonadales bacterium]